jgi:glyoxylase-like metal-dependent hydrolase (beta-lactamase superfamily II)/8-oxo-dGTP pyrophosphatase MutT (NUDIX family)
MPHSGPSTTAGVVLTRGEGDQFELFWARRPDSAGFLGGFYSYFVGRLESVDADTPLDLDEDELRVDHAFYAAALRELHEESGLESQASRLVHLGGWPTPSWLDEDFYTEFFWLHLSDEACARLDVDKLPKRVDRDEIAFSEWIRPQDAIERWSTGRALMTTPLVAIVDILANTPADQREGSLDRRWQQHQLDAPMELVGGLRILPLETITIPPATHTNCFIVGDEAFVVVDPGSADDDELELLFDAIDELVSQGRRFEAVVLTHHHPDHISGVEAVVARYEQPVWAHHEAAMRLDFPVDRELEDGESIALGDDTLTCLHTPGHAPGHLCLFHERTGSILVGDLVASKGTIVINPPEGHVGDYMESLRRIRDLEPRTLFPAHGWAITSPRERLDFYIDHRKQRERSILEALRRADTPATPIDLVPEVYDDVPKHVWPLAARSLLAHLVHLVEEDFAETDGEAFWAVGAGY